MELPVGGSTIAIRYRSCSQWSIRLLVASFWLAGSSRTVSGVATIATSSTSPSASSPVAAIVASSGSAGRPRSASGVSGSPSVPPLRYVGLVSVSSAVSTAASVSGGWPAGTEVSSQMRQNSSVGLAGSITLVTARECAALSSMPEYTSMRVPIVTVTLSVMWKATFVGSTGWNAPFGPR